MHQLFLLLIFWLVCFNAIAGEGTLQLTADQGGWSIYLNGQKKAVTPNSKEQAVKIQLKKGLYTIELVKDHNQWYELYKDSLVLIEADSIQPLQVELWDAKPRAKASTIEHNRQQMAAQGWVDNGDGTATNKNTKLTWKRCFEGQTWSGGLCQGQPQDYTWDEAKKLKSNFAGKTDWRLPTIDELHTIVYCTDGRLPIQKTKEGKTIQINGENADGRCLGKAYQIPPINVAVFPMLSPGDTWSSSTIGDMQVFGWGNSFYYGNDGYFNRYTPSHARLVRGGQ